MKEKKINKVQVNHIKQNEEEQMDNSLMQMLGWTVAKCEDKWRKSGGKSVPQGWSSMMKDLRVILRWEEMEEP